MKLSMLKPCAVCGGPLPPIWQVVKVSMAALDRNATNSVLGVSQILGGSGQALAIAEVMAPGAEEAVMIAGEKDDSLWAQFNVCQACYLTKNFNLAEVAERERGKYEEATA
jgi:hypothetical protein